MSMDGGFSRSDSSMDKFMSTYGTNDSNKNEIEKRIEKIEMDRQLKIMEYNKSIIEELLKDNSTRPVRVKQVNLIGERLNQFRDHFLSKQLEPLLKNNERLTLENFLKNVDLTTSNFVKSGTITNIGMSIIPIDYKSPFTSSNTIELITNVEILPIKKFFMKIGTNIGNGEGDGYLTLQYKNIFGGGESINFDTNIGSNTSGQKNKSQYFLNFTSPINNNSNYKIDSILYHSSRFIDYTTYHEQEISGITNKLSTNYGLNELNHELSLELYLRSIKLHQSLSPFRNNSMINDYFLFNSGDSFKSSLIYNLNYDSRDSQILPTKGFLIKNSIEFNGLFNNDKFIKNQTDFNIGLNFQKSIIFNGNFKIGYIKNLNSLININPMDKFQLGGSNDIRGFWNSGLGPKQMGLSIGGDAFYGIGLSLFNKLPFINKESNFKMHSFYNMGKLINLNGGNNKKINLINEFKTFSSSIGTGIVYAHPSARFELNFVIPLSIHNGDEIRKGLQYGIGLSFM